MSSSIPTTTTLPLARQTKPCASGVSVKVAVSACCKVTEAQSWHWLSRQTEKCWLLLVSSLNKIKGIEKLMYQKTLKISAICPIWGQSDILSFLQLSDLVQWSPNVTSLIHNDDCICSPPGEDRRVRVWDLGTGRLLKELRGHSEVVYTLAFDENSQVLASGGADCCLRLWDVKKTPDTHQSVHTSFFFTILLLYLCTVIL